MRTLSAVTVVAALGAVMAVGGSGAPAVGAPAIPIHFAPPGYTHGVGHGYLHNIHDRNLFVFHAHAGQHVRVNIVGRGPTRGVLTFPNGQGDGGPGGVVFDDQVPVTGRYRLRVTESQMANQWHGPVRVYVRRY